MKMPLSGLWAEFKAFAFQGNMIELAVAVVIGAAFGTVIHSLVEDVIMPTVGYAVNTATTAAEKAKDAAVDATKTVAAKTGVIAASEPTTASTVATTTATITPADAGAIAAADKAAADKATADKAAADKAAADKAAADKAGANTKPVDIKLMIGPVNIGAFLTALINFLLVAAAVFLMIVKLLGGVMKKVKGPEKPGEPTTRECPECLSIIPIKARRCSHCTAVIEPPVAMA